MDELRHARRSLRHSLIFEELVVRVPLPRWSKENGKRTVASYLLLTTLRERAFQEEHETRVVVRVERLA